MYSYTVRCKFTDDAVTQSWIDWLYDQHIQDVIDAGAFAAEIFKMDGDRTCYEIRYQFKSEEAFREYESNHAPRLREEGLAKFPIDLGLEYSRSSGVLQRKFTA